MRDAQTTPAPESHFGFDTAIRWMRKGQKVRRPHWPDGYHFLFSEGETGEYLAASRGDGVAAGWCALPSVSREDVVAKDWEIFR